MGDYNYPQSRLMRDKHGCVHEQSNRRDRLLYRNQALHKFFLNQYHKMSDLIF